MECELSQLLQLRDKECLAEDPKSCCAKDYVESFIFPVLLPALNEMLTAAKKELVLDEKINKTKEPCKFEVTNYEVKRKRTKFNACDFITEYLYNKNPKRTEETDVDLWEIPFVKEILIRKPRPPLPLSLVWSETEAALVIQSFWRGYLVRRDPEVQELRQYQKEMRENSYHIMFRVQEFWKQHNIEDLKEDQEDNEEVEEKEVEKEEVENKP